MKSVNDLFRAIALVLALAATAQVAMADGDIYSRLFEMKEMDKNKDGMVSKEEFLAMMDKAWDMQAADKGIKDGKMDAAHLRDLEMRLGRSLGASSAN